MKIFKNHLTKSQATDLFKKIKSQTNPDVTNLQRLMNFHKAPIGTKEEIQALNLKYRAMTYVPTVLEKTMTPAQLYDAGCPLWCTEYSIEQLSYYFTYEFELPTGENVINYLNNYTAIMQYIPWTTNISELSPTDIMSHQIISGFASPRKKSKK